MKKALVCAVVLVLGLGAWAFAAAPFSGEWKTTIGIDVSAASFADFFTKFDSSLKVDYTLGSWVFGSKSSFGLVGYKSQSFTAAGTIGAFSFDSTMAFSPMVVTVWTYPALSSPSLPSAQTGSTVDAICNSTTTPWKGTAKTFAPAFLTWTATGSVSIAGVTLEGLFFLDQSNVNVIKEDYLFLAPVSTGDYTQTDTVSCASAYNGSGWRFKVSGQAAGMTITSLTYFNLYEYTISEYNSIYGLLNCPSIGMSGLYEIDDCTCDVAFTREYITVEGFAFGCATIDLALDITCSGFQSLTALVQNVVIGGWLNLDFSITFATASKTFASCLTLTGMTTDCYTIEIGFASGTTITGNTIGDITIHGVGLTYTWNGLTFSSFTELTAYSALFSTNTAWSYIYGHDKYGFLVPYTGYDVCAVCVDCCNDTAGQCWTLGEHVYELKCVAEDRFKLWEKFQLKYASDACCGGAFSLTLDTYFGDYEVLDYYGYVTYVAGTTAVGTPVYLYGSAPSTSPFSALSSKKTCDYVSVKYAYKAGTMTTLFDWAKSTVKVSFGLGSNFTIDLGAAIDAFGWESLDFGFTATF